MPNTVLKRRNAQREQNVAYIQMGHEFQRNYFTQPTNCAVCKQFLWGVRKKQGFQCKFCSMAVHTKCIENVMTKCMKSKQTRQSQMQGPSSIKIDIPHKWRAKTFAWPTMCTHCGQLIKGIFKQGLQCQSCKITAHKKCKDLIANTCGTNMHQLNQIMASFDNINLPAPKEVTNVEDVQVLYLNRIYVNQKNVFNLRSMYRCQRHKKMRKRTSMSARQTTSVHRRKRPRLHRPSVNRPL